MRNSSCQLTARFDLATAERIKQAARQSTIPVSAWIRLAVRNELNQENTKSGISQIREELAANVVRILNQCRSLSNAQQATIALVDTLTKYILSVSPEPGADAQKLGKRRYAQFQKAVTIALQSNILQPFEDSDGDKKKPN